MKVNDLMIADLIMSYDVPLRVIGLSMKAKRYDPIYVGKVNCEDMKELGDEYWTTEDEVFGIHITAEILVKNGFDKKSNKSFRYIDEDARIEMDFYIGNGLFNITKHLYLEDEETYSFPEPYDVHQLQHALRLCGLNEMADNIQI